MGSGVVFFDPLGAFASGEDVENDNAQMRAVIDAMGVITAPGAMVALAHMGKPTYDPKASKFIRRPSYATRGGSAIEDAVTDCFYFAHEGATFRLLQRKYKGDAPSHYLLSRDEETLRHTLTSKGKTRRELSEARRAAIRHRWDTK